MKLETDPILVDAIRQLKAGGKTGAEILHYLSHHSAIPGAGLIIYFCEAFNLEFGDVAAIGGWSADGTGELSDQAINRFIDKALRRHTDE